MKGLKMRENSCMSLAWTSDFSYEYFKRILRAVKSNFELYLLSEVPGILNSKGSPKLILRHDVDVSLKMALKMAAIENNLGVRSTYMVMTRSPLYDIENDTSRGMLLQLIDMGHEVGLHFDLDKDERDGNYEISRIELKIDYSCGLLQNITGLPIGSISFHHPIPPFLRGPLMVSGRINAYSKKLMEWYLSDSKGCWREGEPLPQLTKPDKHLLQLLIHPIWWGDKHMLPEDRLQEFFDTEIQGRLPQYIKAFDTNLANIITTVRRRDYRDREDRQDHLRV
jgi:hypothetical protein